MPTRELSPSLVSLLHHIELNRTGWWDRSLQRLITAALWLSGRTLTPDALLEDLRSAQGVEVDDARFASQIETLLQRREILKLPGGELKISEQSALGLKKDFDEAQANAGAAAIEFGAALRTAGSALDPSMTWQKFQRDFLIPFVRTAGARTYEVVSGKRLPDSGEFRGFLDQFGAEHREPLREAIVAFLGSNQPSVRAHVLQYLNSSFVLTSSNLDAGDLQTLTQSVAKQPRLRLFLDTNFLFSVLGIHDDLASACAAALLGLVTRVSNRVTVRLYVTDTTVDELTRAIYGRIAELKQLRLTENIAKGVAPMLSGPLRKYADECARAGRAIDPEDYFGPFAKNALALLKDKGVELFNQPTDRYSSRQDVVDDVQQQRQYEKRKFAERAKSYDRIEHDVVLWHFVHDRRPPRVESPLQAEYWVITEDSRLLAYDARKGRRNGQRVCLHPTVFVQLLQFWLPRSAEFDNALFGSLGLAALFRVDNESEQLTVRILEALSRFEDVGDLSEDAVRSILISDALRQRIERSSGPNQEFELVREELLQHGKKLQRSLDEARAAEAKLKDSLVLEQAERAALEAALAGKSSEVELAARAAVREKAKADDLERRIGDLERASRESVARSGARGESLEFTLFVVCSAVALSLAGVGLAWLLYRFGGFERVNAVVASACSALVAIVVTFDRAGSKRPTIATSSWFLRLQRWKNLVVSVLVVAIIGNLATDAIKFAYAWLADRLG